MSRDSPSVHPGREWHRKRRNLSDREGVSRRQSKRSIDEDRPRNGDYGGGGSSWSSSAGAAPSSGWQPQQSLFSMPVGTEDGTFGKTAGDFHVGQLVQVTRSDGSWTYGKVMAYDAGGDTYSVMTRAGAKHFVERADLTDDVVVNPSDGSCAQQ